MTALDGIYEVHLGRENASRWSWSVRNPVGGSGGSSNRGPKKAALHYALGQVPQGARYVIITERWNGSRWVEADRSGTLVR